jgi:hypothetical protein
MIHPKTRTGATLTEVLVAIFVMAIGLLALLTLFPLGALSMAQAIKDGRTAQSSKNAFAIAEAANIHNDPFVLNDSLIPLVTVYPTGVPGAFNNSTSYFLNPYPQLLQRPGLPPQPPLDPLTSAGSFAPDLVTNIFLAVPGHFGQTYDGPSYPIYVDPFGWQNYPPLVANAPGNSPGLTSVLLWVVGGIYPAATSPPAGVNAPVGYSSIPRLPLSFLPVNPNPLAVNPLYATQSMSRWCTLTEDITFGENGTPSLTTGPVQRENRYTWAWLLRRPKANDPSVVDVTVVVYSGRSRTNPGETPYYPVAFDTTSKFVDINYVGTRPSVRAGSWILDATMEYYRDDWGLNVPDPHGFFYRVVGVTDLNSTTMRLELQTYPKKGSIYTNPFPPNASKPYGVLIVMENVVEVFEKGPGWQP